MSASEVTREQAIASIRAAIARGDPRNRIYRKTREALVKRIAAECKAEGEWPVEHDVLQLTAEQVMAEDGIFRHGELEAAGKL